jgi:hypothetical protein
LPKYEQSALKSPNTSTGASSPALLLSDAMKAAATNPS